VENSLKKQTRTALFLSLTPDGRSQGKSEIWYRTSNRVRKIQTSETTKNRFFIQGWRARLKERNGLAAYKKTNDTHQQNTHKNTNFGMRNCLFDKKTKRGKTKDHKQLVFTFFLMIVKF